jgi:hypothetical protein
MLEMSSENDLGPRHPWERAYVCSVYLVRYVWRVQKNASSSRLSAYEPLF